MYRERKRLYCLSFTAVLLSCANFVYQITKFYVVCVTIENVKELLQVKLLQLYIYMPYEIQNETITSNLRPRQ